MAREATSITIVETARIHCGPKYLVRREADCTPMMMPMELTAKRRPYSCGVNWYRPWKMNGLADRYENRPVKFAAPTIAMPTKTRSLSTER